MFVMLKNKLLVTNNSSILKNLLLAFFVCILLDNVALAQATFSIASGSSATGCAPLTVNFTGSCPGCTNFVITGWSATPGSINSPTATLTFPNAGTYAVTMNYTINGVPGTTTQPNFVTAYPNPVVDFSTPNTTICQGQSACFTPNITSGTAPFTYTWVAGQSSSATSPCITYNSPGAYTVSLTVTDTHGCTGTKSVPSYLNVPIPPDATFTTTYSAGQCNPPVTASFLWTGTPQSATYTHSWNFGSTPTSTASGNPAVNHTYNAVGVYDVTHIVTNAGCSDTVTVPGAVVVGINPIPAIIINDTTPCKNDQINAQCPTGGFTYAWTSTAGLVGTSGPPTNFSATITCSNTGPQTITCTMTQAVTGCTTTVVKNIFVDPGPQFVIVADDTVDCAPPFTVKFHLEDGAGNCLSNLQPSWLNPTPVTTIPGICPQYQYQYTTAGNFDVSVLATNLSGCSGAITQTNYIHIQSPTADFVPTQLDPVLICAGQSVQFTDMSVPVPGAPITTWAWSFTANGNTTTSSLPNPIKTFNVIAGLNNYNVTVTLVVTDANGCTSTKTYTACVKVGVPLNFTTKDFIQVGGNTNLCGTQTISYQASISIANPPFPPGVNVLWQYLNPTSTPPYYSPYYTTGINGIMTFNPDSLGPFCVKMIVNNNGCKDSITKCNQFTMSGPIAKFSSLPEINCSLPALYTFADTSIGLSGAPLNNVWKIYDMNNGGTLITPPVTNQANYSYTFNTATLIKVVLVRTEGSCTDSISKFINVTETRADFTASDTVICIGSPIGFTPDIQTGLNYKWSFGIGAASSTQMSPFYTYPLPGAYNVVLAVDGNGGFCKDTAYKTIIVNGSKVNIMEAANDTISCFPAPAVNLTGNIQAIYPAGTSISIWSWGFSDGGTANGQNVNHLFTTANYNYAYLYATDANGCISGDTLRFVMPDPQADFTAPTTTSCAGKQLLFASTSVGINGSTLSYIWNYGDGPNTISSPQDTSYHTYTANGPYNVTLIVSDIYGCKDTAINTGFITITPFVADYTVSDTFKSCPTLNVLCTASSVSGHTIDTTTLQWILYDNPPPASISYITSQYSPTIPITVPGLYTLSLVIQSTTGCKDTVQKNNLIHVLGPKTDFTVTPPKACPGATISLQAINGTPDIISYSWLLTGGNATNSTSQNASVTYNTPGVYFPIVVVNNGVCTVTMPAADSVIIVNPPKASFTVSDSIVCVPDNIQFTDTSVPGDGAINGWNWDLGLGNTSTIKNPSQNYAVVGVYPITLIVTDANGCKDTTSKNVSAIQNLQPTPVAILRTSVVNNNQIAIRFAPYNNVNNDFGQYLLYRSLCGGVPVLLATIPNIANTTYLDNSVSTSNNCYEYSLKVENGCGNISNFSTSSSASSLSSTPLAGAIKITWTPYVGWATVNKYNVYRVYDYDTTTHVLLGSVSGSAVNLTYTDSISIRCLDPISYRIEAIQTGTGVNAWSDTTICAPFNASVNAQVHVKVATVENNAVKITWNVPQNVRYLQEYYVEKDTSFVGSFYPIGTAIPASSTLEFIDTDVNVARRPYTYRVTGKDSCNNFLQPGRTGTSMVLIATPIASRIELNWTPYTLWKNGVLKYRIQLFNSNVPEWVTIDSVAGNVLAYTDDEIRFALSQNCYRIVAVENQGGKSISMSNESCGALEPVIYTPTAFTPNGDNVNDFFVIKGTFVITYHIRIYNNWGQMVYESNDLTKGWDGKINGTDCPEGTYVYHVEITSLTGEKKQKAGSITLIR